MSESADGRVTGLTKPSHLISLLTHSFTSYVLFSGKVSDIALPTQTQRQLSFHYHFRPLFRMPVWVVSQFELYANWPTDTNFQNTISPSRLPSISTPSLFVHLPPNSGLGESLVKHEEDVLCPWHSFITSFLGKWLRDEDFPFSPAASYSLSLPLKPSLSFQVGHGNVQLALIRWPDSVILTERMCLCRLYSSSRILIPFL